jgi:hypothetical protein
MLRRKNGNKSGSSGLRRLSWRSWRMSPLGWQLTRSARIRPHHQQRSYPVAEYMTQVRRFLRHRTGSATTYQPLTVMLTRDRDGMASSRKTGCRNTVTRTLPLGAVPTAFSHRTMISSRIRARRVASDFTTWWTPRKCFFVCSLTFGAIVSFHKARNPLPSEFSMSP